MNGGIYMELESWVCPQDNITGVKYCGWIESALCSDTLLADGTTVRNSTEIDRKIGRLFERV